MLREPHQAAASATGLFSKTIEASLLRKFADQHRADIVF
jgi:hypothetical protein